MSDEMDRGHIKELYVSPGSDKPPPPSPYEMDRSHIKELYVTPVADPEVPPEPDPELVRREAYAREKRAHAELVQRMQDKDRKRAAKSVEPTSIEGQD